VNKGLTQVNICYVGNFDKTSNRISGRLESNGFFFMKMANILKTIRIDLVIVLNTSMRPKGGNAPNSTINLKIFTTHLKNHPSQAAFSL
jgi:hypothetical protein